MSHAFKKAVHVPSCSQMGIAREGAFDALPRQHGHVPAPSSRLIFELQQAKHEMIVLLNVSCRSSMESQYGDDR